MVREGWALDYRTLLDRLPAGRSRRPSAPAPASGAASSRRPGSGGSRIVGANRPATLAGYAAGMDTDIDACTDDPFRGLVLTHADFLGADVLANHHRQRAGLPMVRLPGARLNALHGGHGLARSEPAGDRRHPAPQRAVRRRIARLPGNRQAAGRDAIARPSGRCSSIRKSAGRATSRRWCGTPTRWPGADPSMMSWTPSGRCGRSADVTSAGTSSRSWLLQCRGERNER